MVEKKMQKMKTYASKFNGQWQQTQTSVVHSE